MAEDSIDTRSRQSQARDARRQRSAAKRARRRVVYGILGGSVGLALILGLFLPQLGQIGGGRTNNNTTPDQIGDAVGTQVAIQAGGVIQDGAAHDAYITVPAASGPRYAQPADWGVSDEPLAEEAVLANLERGGVAINHNLTDEGSLASLTAFIEGLNGYPGCLVQRPHTSVAEGSVVVTAWGWTQEFAEVNTEGIALFIATHQNQAPLYIGIDCGAGQP